MTLKGMPFQTLAPPPLRNVGTPDSAETPAPVSTSTRLASANLFLNSSEINSALVCMKLFKWMVTERTE
jgi:hypothetical protein